MSLSLTVNKIKKNNTKKGNNGFKVKSCTRNFRRNMDLDLRRHMDGGTDQIYAKDTKILYIHCIHLIHTPYQYNAIKGTCKTLTQCKDSTFENIIN